MEIWKDIEGYEGKYQVSSWGRVKSLNYNHTGKEQCIKPEANNKGYFQVALCKNGKVQRPYVHRLVASAFLSNPNNLSEINHKDENPKNNCVSNIEWISHKDNCRYGTRNERILENRTGPFKEKQIYCVELDMTFKSSHEAERQTGANQQNIISCCQGKRKRAGGFHWKYKGGGENGAE